MDTRTGTGTVTGMSPTEIAHRVAPSLTHDARAQIADAVASSRSGQSLPATVTDAGFAQLVGAAIRGTK